MSERKGAAPKKKTLRYGAVPKVRCPVCREPMVPSGWRHV